jgi:hypothetical protein
VKLRIVCFEKNALTGTIPTSMNQIVNLRDVYFGFNTLTGSIPDDVCDLSELLRLEADCSICEVSSSPDGYGCCSSCVD